MDQLSPQDSQFLYMESDDNLTHVTSIAVFDPTTVPGGKVVRFKDIIEHVESRLHMNPLFRRKLVRVPLELDFPYWVDDPRFDIENHIMHGRLPRPGDWRQFCIHMARYHSRPLDMRRPLWEMYVIEGLGKIDWLPEGAYAIATKIHHAAVDGKSIIDFFGAMADVDNKGTPAVPLDKAPLTRSPQPSLLDMGVRAAWHTVRSPVGMMDALMRATPSIYNLAQGALRSKKEARRSVPVTRFNGQVSAQKMFDAMPASLDELKAIRAAVPGSTINDVVLCICGGALRHYLEHHRELPADSLVAWVPINARTSGGSHDNRPGNKITSMTAPIHTDIQDPVHRLQQIMMATQRSKAAKSGVSARLMTDLSQHVPAATQVVASRLVLNASRSVRVCNLFISNVPGPQVPLYMNGAKQVGAFGMAPLANGMGLFIATPSYNGNMFFNITSTREVMPDIQFFVECLQKSLEELKRAAMPKPKSPGKKKGRKKVSAVRDKARTNGHRSPASPSAS